VRVIARIEDPDLIETILAHRGESQAPRSILIALRPESRVPPGPERSRHESRESSKDARQGPRRACAAEAVYATYTPLLLPCSHRIII